MAVRVNGKSVLNTTEGAQETVEQANIQENAVRQAADNAPQGEQEAGSATKAQNATRAAPITEAEMARAEQETNESLKREQTVRVKLPLIDKNEPYVEVGINGVIKLIQRGVTVDLPISIVEVLEHAGII